MRRHIFASIITAAVLLAAVGAAQGAVIRAASASYADVTAAVATAVSGDTVIVPAGSEAWNSTLTITKGINLIGAGIGNTVITSAISSGYLIRYYPSDYDADYAFRLSGFTFDMNDRSCITLGQGGKNAPFTRQTKIRIDHNRFTNAPTQTHQAIWNHSEMNGVVDNNQFDGVAYPIRSDAGVGNSSWWDNFPPLAFGSADNLYFEDNTFSGVSAGIISDCQYSGRYAFRYNTFMMPVDSYPFFDMHGNQYSSNPGASMWSCFGAELYGNRVDAGAHVVNFLDQRGGKAMVFYNSIITSSTDSSSASMKVREEVDDALCPSTSPQPQHVADSYYWNNRKNSATLFKTKVSSGPTGTATGAGVDYLDDSRRTFDSGYGRGVYGLEIYGGTGAGQHRRIINAASARLTVTPNWQVVPDITSQYRIISDCCDALHENIEFFNQNTSFDGSGGIGCGTFAQRPVTCAPDAAYWATTQACGSVDAANVGAHPAVPISGTLYKCTAPNTWTAYYTPYTYPHPLTKPDTHTAASCFLEDVQAALIEASDGDTVLIPVGTAAWNSTLVINKSVTLKGSGIDLTKISGPSGVPFTLISIEPTINIPIRVTGIHFYSPDYMASVGGYQIDVKVRGIAAGLYHIRIDNCKFTNGTDTVWVGGYAYPLIDHNEFVDNLISVRLIGQDNVSWAREIVPGTNNAVFVEDNTFTYKDTPGSGAGTCSRADSNVYQQEGTRLVYRYNKVTNLCQHNMVQNAVDGHGNQPGGIPTDPLSMRGTIMTEIYENTWNFWGISGTVSVRGGSHLIYNNTLNCTYSACIPFKFTDEEGWESGGPWATKPYREVWPAYDQIFNSFIWGNKRNGVDYNTVHLPMTTVHPLDDRGHDDIFIQENRDFFYHAPEASGGKESFPTTAGNDDMIFTASGINAYYPYTPYVYPHPLAAMDLAYGDISGNGSITAYDAALALQNDPRATVAKADVNGDLAVDALDAALIAQKTVGIIG